MIFWKYAKRSVNIESILLSLDSRQLYNYFSGNYKNAIVKYTVFYKEARLF